MVLALHPKHPTQAAATLADPAATYTLVYFDTHGIVSTIRNLLVLAGAEFDEVHAPDDWDTNPNAAVYKLNTPFGVLPILKVHPSAAVKASGANGQDEQGDVLISESRAIELFLAEKYNFLGKDLCEKTLIQTFYFSTIALITRLAIIVQGLRTATDEAKKEQLGLFVMGMKEWITYHEAHLSNNGNNGHYVGDALSVADLATAMCLSMGARFPMFSALASKELTPGLWAVQEAVDNDPRIVAYREEERFKCLRGSRAEPRKSAAA